MSTYKDSVTGKGFIPKQVDLFVTAVALPFAPAGSLGNKSHPINIEELSGKQEGAMVLSEGSGVYYLHIARGNQMTSPWDTHKFGGSDFTPVA